MNLEANTQYLVQTNRVISQQLVASFNTLRALALMKNIPPAEQLQGPSCDNCVAIYILNPKQCTASSSNTMECTCAYTVFPSWSLYALPRRPLGIASRDEVSDLDKYGVGVTAVLSVCCSNLGRVHQDSGRYVLVMGKGMREGCLSAQKLQSVASNTIGCGRLSLPALKGAVKLLSYIVSPS